MRQHIKLGKVGGVPLWDLLIIVLVLVAVLHPWIELRQLS